MIWEFDISDPNLFDGEEFHKPYFFLVNMAVGGTLTGIFSAAEITAPFPAEMSLEYIRLYDNGYTILGIPTSSPVSAPTCLENGNTCTENADCCSNSCSKGRFKTCQP